MTSKKKKSKPARKIGDELLESLSVGDDAEFHRDVAVMTRIDERLVKLLDMLVRLGLFNSRAEAVASILEKTLVAQLDKFELLQKQIDKLEELQQTARDIAPDVLSKDG